MHDPEKNHDGREGKINPLRAIKWGLVMFGAVVAIVGLAAVLTDGSPDQPFDYETSETD